MILIKESQGLRGMTNGAEAQQGEWSDLIGLTDRRIQQQAFGVVRTWSVSHIILIRGTIYTKEDTKISH